MPQLHCDRPKGDAMSAKKQERSHETLPLKLTAAEKKLVLEGLIYLDREIERIVKDTPAGQPVKMTLDDLTELAGSVAAEANHCHDKAKCKKLDRILSKIEALLDELANDAPGLPSEVDDFASEEIISQFAGGIAQFSVGVRVAAEQIGIDTMVLETLPLVPHQRETLGLVSGVTPAIKKKLAQEGARFTLAEVASMSLALAKELPNRDGLEQVAGIYLARHLMEHLRAVVVDQIMPSLPKQRRGKSKATQALYQFKITLLGSKPLIWRRIQVENCTLDKLHEHIQTAMGWTNSHLHQFEIKGEWYGDPELLDDDFGDSECVDSTSTLLSDILPKSSKRFAFKYEYDFGDSWEHEVLFEGSPALDSKAKYPLCLEGERACPPEDCGGIWGYADFLEAIRDPQHKEHEDLLSWVGGRFDPEKFDAKAATKAMKKGLPDWRRMRP
jgi:hypothetical protein